EVERTIARRLLLRIAEEGKGFQDVRPNVGWRRAWSLTAYAADALEGLDPAMDAMKERLSALQDDGGALVKAFRAVPPSENLLLRMFTLAWPAAVRSHVDAVAWTRVARTGIAVAEFRAREGRLPAALEDLVPALLPAVPLDPWNGKPLRYAPGKVW